MICDNGGNITGSSGGAAAGSPVGHVMQFAIDITAGKWWMRYDGGTWHGGGLGTTPDPATGVNGADYTASVPASTAVFPFCMMIDFGTVPTTTINTGDSAFANAAPSGFSAWGVVDGIASGSLITVTTSMIAGTAGFTGNAAGATLTVTTSLLRSGAAAGALLTSTVTLLPGTAVGRAVDGSKIFESSFGIAQQNHYQESDYFSMWSKGDRIRSGTKLLTAGEYGWTFVSAPATEAFDNNTGSNTGDGPALTGPVGAALWFNSGDHPLDIRGVRFIGGGELIAGENGNWTFKGGFGIGEVEPNSYAQEFDAMTPQQGPGFLPATNPANNIVVAEFLMTPRLPVVYNHFEFKFVSGTRTEDRFCNEMELKVSHSNLDGGDRRSTNGRPEKQVQFSMSPEWVYSGSAGIDPADSLFDGLHTYANSFDITLNGHTCAIGKNTATTGQPVTIAGAWLQFVFPRPVIFEHLMVELKNADLEVYSAGNPTKYGRWHWEYSKNAGVTWAQTGSSWSFVEDQTQMYAPRDFSIFDIDRTSTGVGDNGVTHWRMVLEAGPAFGFAQVLSELIFDLYDVTGQAPTFSINFTDDTDGTLVPFTAGTPGSPYSVFFSDGTDDTLTGTPTVTPNPVLIVHYDDGATFDTWSDLYPSVTVQTIVIATGR